MKRAIKFRAWDNRIGAATSGMTYDAETHPNWSDFISYPLYYTVMEFSGLADKNGALIYEGDILKCSFRRDNFYVEVRFHQGCFLFGNRAPLEFLQYNEVEIVGNIYNNPELMKEYL
jgi:hypothetical protein